MRTQLITAILFSLTLVNCQVTKSSKSATPTKALSSLTNRIDELVKSYGNKAKIGVQITDLKDNQVIYEHNEHQQFTPASVLKLYTTAAALFYLGPSFRFKTVIYGDNIKNNQMQNLYIKAGGDPNFSADNVNKIVSVLKQRGVKLIIKNIIIDESIFDDIHWGNGWMWNDMINGYSAPVSALNIEHNRIAVFAWPGEKAGDLTFITTEPYTNFIEIKNSSKTLKENERGNISFSLSSSDNKNKTDAIRHGLKFNQTIYVSGGIASNKKYQYETFALDDSFAFLSYYLKEQLKKNGIKFTGKIISGDIPKSANEIDTITSKALNESLLDFVKFSNNHAAETLLKTIGLNQDGAPGTFKNGLNAIKNFLKQDVKLDTHGLIIADGSGLSRYSLTSPNQLTDLLAYMWHNFKMGPEFISALPIAGEDGTINGTWKGSSLKGNIRAKSGTMSNICSLAGYLNSGENNNYAFTFLINGSTQNTIGCRQFFDDILVAVAQ
ncbi:MAG: D-alanyl-D-alanine carboxypeptidase/D-alanyl-D-alanine-endopeptidase [bacterium]|nr:D-alanyl-D-alanine carboxypeptidase/D-alanyl-D-alanine-endopeptidase [bacterium]